MLLPGTTLGVLGGGQLGRMFCLAARVMGYRTMVLDPDSACPAGQVADEQVIAAFDDTAGLQRLAQHCDVVTIEFENVPALSLEILADSVRVYPPAECVHIAQDRLKEKRFACDNGVDTAPFAEISDAGQVDAAMAITGLPAILKTATLGYDGKGQAVVHNREQLLAAFEAVQNVPCVLEKKLDLEREVSVLLVRNVDAETGVYPLSENEHRNGILHTTRLPAAITPAQAERAQQAALKLANRMGYVGVLAIEFFITTDGQLIFNEMAPRPHNSGHYTQDACATSQFEQQVRVICGLPPGDCCLLSPVVMLNLLGDLWDPDWSHVLRLPGAKLHLYGKHEARPGRKMGHVNLLAESVERASELADELFLQLQSSSQKHTSA